MIFGIKEKSIILTYNVLLAIATNIPVLLMTGFVVQGHILLLLSDGQINIYANFSFKLTKTEHFIFTVRWRSGSMTRIAMYSSRKFNYFKYYILNLILNFYNHNFICNI